MIRLPPAGGSALRCRVQKTEIGRQMIAAAQRTVSREVEGMLHTLCYSRLTTIWEGLVGSGGSGLQLRGKARLSQTHFARAQPHSLRGQGSSMVPWISTQTPPLTLASRASPPPFPRGPGSSTLSIFK
ncbi:unnamed protein product [Pleuronectes platessa]|uniref:Uncharacterized protein n=1 Tax=Pleuronectes platessa TaxID=8262 RepID=A0A9N7UC99_PLEPL|nr:unnamed protein product [Pleuronectes platessa]